MWGVKFGDSRGEFWDRVTFYKVGFGLGYLSFYSIRGIFCSYYIGV